MTLLVTGGAGFIGSHFVRYILETYPEDQIINVDVLTYAGNLENLTDVVDDPRYTFVRADICDKNAIEDIIKNNTVDAIVHFAAESHVDRSILDPSAFIRTNVLGTQVLLDIVREHGIRFHHVSTDEVFGALGLDDPAFDESTPYDPRSPYSASKAAADHLVRAYYHTYGIKMTISNCSNNYGPNMFPEKMLPLFMTRLFKNKKVPVYGDGAQIRDWIHVKDHVRGVDTILRQGRIGETYCLGGKEAEVTNLELTYRLLDILGKDESLIEFVTDRPGHDFRYAIDYTKAHKELGWKPQISLSEGLTDMVKWYQANTTWVERCLSGAYQEYYKKQYGEK